MPLTADDRAQIQSIIVPLLRAGDLSLLLGSGFTVDNPTATGTIPGTDSLLDFILQKANKARGPRTSLRDAYVLGQREIHEFPSFLQSLFTVSAVPAWQQRLFQYPWKRIYTTNIDNVLDVASEQAKKSGPTSGEFKFFNYCDPGLVSETIGSIPVVNIHGTCRRLEDGFIFSSLEYAKASAKVWDWHRELAAKALSGGLVVIGNQLDESDLESYIVQREFAYPTDQRPHNWIVMPTPDPIKAENYRAAGYYVFDASAQEFLTELYANCEARSMTDIVIESNPLIRRAITNVRAMTWFRGSMSPVASEIEAAKKETGILRHFMTGAEPAWFYITQSAHAETSRTVELTRKVAEMMASHSSGIDILHVIGPSGSGKTTTIRSALQNLVATYPYIYEFNESASLDTDLLRETIGCFTGKSIFIFYSSAEFYYAVNYIVQHFSGRTNPYCLFVLEDRTNEYKKNARQIRNTASPKTFEISDLSLPDATAIARKIESHGLVFDGFSEHQLDARARIIIDKERGYAGDLLSTLFSLTTHENFERKIHEDYYALEDGPPRFALEAVALIHSLGLPVPIGYLAGFLGLSIDKTYRLIEDDLAGVLTYHRKQDNVRCRHRIIANYYFDACISKQGSSKLILNVLQFLSRQFTVEDIKGHPLPYRIYKEIIVFEFLFDLYFAVGSRLSATEAIYHECQTLFGKDGIFWLQFGRFYRKTERLDEAIECFKTGLIYFESFQTRHSLGVAHLERYIRDRCTNKADYENGVELLEGERIGRGASDPYPTGTLIDWLLLVVAADSKNEDAVLRLKNAINYGMQHFRSDQYVNERIQRYFAMERPNR